MFFEMKCTIKSKSK